jgi:Zn-dependent metalloprotease
MKFRFLTTILVVVAFFAPTMTFGQGFIPTALRSENTVIQSLSKKVEPAGWLYLKDEAQVLSYDLFSIYKTNMGLSADDEMVVTKDETDEYGWQHIRYQQYYKNIKVEGAEYTEHIKDCIVKIAHGKLLENANKSVTPVVSEIQALDIALDHIGATTYSWEDNSPGVNEYEEDEEYDTLPPQGELLLGYITQTGILPENYKLVWRFEVISVDPGAAYEMYIDAQTGGIVRQRSLEYDNGPAVLLYGYGTQTIDTKFHNGLFNDYYFLRAEDNNRNIHTRRGTFAGNNWAQYAEVTDDNDCWGCGTPAPTNIRTTAHWVVSQSWDYFLSTHNRNGMNGSGGKVHVLANSNLDNAGFIDIGTGWIEFGTTLGNGAGAQFAAIDVGGHEYAHGVTRFAAGLGFANQPGALNESFSDIFGFLVERFSGQTDWTVGEDPIPGGLRSLENPGAIPAPPLAPLGLPNVFMGARWFVGGADNGGVHINCGPQNRWFNLLAVGGMEAETGINVQGIGINNAARITYLSLNAFIQNASQYADARQSAIAAAIILFGDCSFEVIQTTNAWAAVGVGNLFAGPCIEIVGPDWICVEPQGLPQTWEADVLAGSNVTWNFPASWNVTLSGQGNKNLTLNSVSPLPTSISTVTISATSSSGGTATLNVLQVHDCELFSPPCPTEDRSNSAISTEFANHQLAKSKITIFPNPANEFISLTVAGMESPFRMSVQDVYGRQVFSAKSGSPDFVLNIEQLQPGIYFLHVSNASFRDVVTLIKK